MGSQHFFHTVKTKDSHHIRVQCGMVNHSLLEAFWVAEQFSCLDRIKGPGFESC